jgi:adenylate kinase family enzyme
MLRSFGDDMDVLHVFYNSKPWKELSYNLKIQRGGKCERCGNKPLYFSNLIGHHKVELNESNYLDRTISLNPDLIEIICLDCHNKEHKRFGYHKQHVYIVYGSPLSGKTTLVKQIMKHGDIVLDIDALWQAITFQDEYVKPNNCRFNVFKLRDELLDQIKTRYGKWNDAYIIGGYPDKYERERLAQSIGAELIYCESTKEECIARAIETGRPEKWLDYIEDWWEKYER